MLTETKKHSPEKSNRWKRKELKPNKVIRIDDNTHRNLSDEYNFRYLPYNIAEIIDHRYGIKESNFSDTELQYLPDFQPFLEIANELEHEYSNLLIPNLIRFLGNDGALELLKYSLISSTKESEKKVEEARKDKTVEEDSIKTKILLEADKQRIKDNLPSVKTELGEIFEITNPAYANDTQNLISEINRKKDLLKKAQTELKRHTIIKASISANLQGENTITSLENYKAKKEKLHNSVNQIKTKIKDLNQTLSDHITKYFDVYIDIFSQKNVREINLVNDDEEIDEDEYSMNIEKRLKIISSLCPYARTIELDKSKIDDTVYLLKYIREVFLAEINNRKQNNIGTITSELLAITRSIIGHSKYLIDFKDTSISDTVFYNSENPFELLIDTEDQSTLERISKLNKELEVRNIELTRDIYETIKSLINSARTDIENEDLHLIPEKISTVHKLINICHNLDKEIAISNPKYKNRWRKTDSYAYDLSMFKSEFIRRLRAYIKDSTTLENYQKFTKFNGYKLDNLLDDKTSYLDNEQLIAEITSQIPNIKIDKKQKPKFDLPITNILATLAVSAAASYLFNIGGIKTNLNKSLPTPQTPTIETNRSDNSQNNDNLLFNSYSSTNNPDSHPDLLVRHRDFDIDSNQAIEIEPRNNQKSIEHINIIEKPNEGLEGIINSSDQVIEYKINQFKTSSSSYKIPIPIGYKVKNIHSNKFFNAKSISFDMDSNPSHIEIESIETPDDNIIISFFKIDEPGDSHISSYLGRNEEKENLDRLDIKNKIENLFNQENQKLKEFIELQSYKYLSGKIDTTEFATSISNGLRQFTIYEFNGKITDFENISETINNITDQIKKGGIICNQSSILMAYILELHGIETALISTIINDDYDPALPGNQVTNLNRHMMVEVKTENEKTIILDPTATGYEDTTEIAKEDKLNKDNLKKFTPLIYISLGILIGGGIGYIKYKKSKNKDIQESQTTSPEKPKTEKEINLGNNFISASLSNQKINQIFSQSYSEPINDELVLDLYHEMLRLTNEYKVFNQQTQIYNLGKNSEVTEKGTILNDNKMYSENDGVPIITEIPETSSAEINDFRLFIDQIISYLDTNPDIKSNKPAAIFDSTSIPEFFQRLKELIP